MVERPDRSCTGPRNMLNRPWIDGRKTVLDTTLHLLDYIGYN
jgi:hypothetical protein